MRKIESQMNRAIRTQSNWSGSNTTVFTSDNGLHSKVFYMVITLLPTSMLRESYNFLTVVGNQIQLSPD